MDVSKLKFDDESMRLIVFSLARETHDFALASHIPSHSVEHQLGLIFGILQSNIGDLLDVRAVLTPDAASLAAIDISFSNKGYRLLADAAKNRVALAVNCD